MENCFRIGTRTSPLALIQIKEMVRCLRSTIPEFCFEVVGMDTCGDMDRITPISKIEGTDFFTREIDAALLSKKIDMAVHSAKDLADELMAGLTIAAITASIDPSDVLVSRNNLTLETLPYQAKIGTSSVRRKKQLALYRDDFEIVDVRGNINDRIDSFDKSDLDGLIIASAGLIRLGLKHRISQKIPLDIMKTHPLQGSLALVVRTEDTDFIDCMNKAGWNIKNRLNTL